MKIGDLLSEALICPELTSDNKYEAIEELLDLLVKNGEVIERDSALQDLIEREQYLSTGLENGLAVPHAKSAATGKLQVCFGISHKGINFESLDNKPANFIFLVLSPRDTSGPHIKVLAQITRNFREKGMAEKLSASETAAEIYQLIQNFK